MTLQLASQDRFEVGSGYAIAGLIGRDAANPRSVRDVRIAGTVVDHLGGDGRRQFTGTNNSGYWSEAGSSGSPVFVDHGQQLAGILSLSELGANEGTGTLREAFVIPGTTIRKHLVRLASANVAEVDWVSLATLQPIFDLLGAENVPVAEVPERIRQFVEAARERAGTPAPVTDDGADIAAAISAARAKLRDLDTDGAKSLLAGKIEEEEQARRNRMLPLLWERFAIERISFDHDSAFYTLDAIAALSPNDPRAWCEQGDLAIRIGSLKRALVAYRRAAEASQRSGNERDLSVSHNKIGDVLVAQGEREEALKSYRASLAIAETLARRDPANTQWQRDLVVSYYKISETVPEEAYALLTEALAIVQRLSDSGRLAPIDRWILDDLKRRLDDLKGQ